MALGKYEDLEINGRKTKAIDYTVTTNNFPGRVWFIQIDDTTVVSIAAFLRSLVRLIWPRWASLSAC